MLNLEISKEYIIKLDRGSYTLSAIQKLLNKIQNDNPIFSYNEQESYGDIRSHINDHFLESYDHLSEK